MTVGPQQPFDSRTGFARSSPNQAEQHVEPSEQRPATEAIRAASFARASPTRAEKHVNVERPPSAGNRPATGRLVLQVLRLDSKTAGKQPADFLLPFA